MPPLAANLKGIILVMLSNLVFVFNDTLIKLTSGHLPTGQIIVMRGVVALIAILALLVATGTIRQWRHALSHFVFWRTMGEIGATMLYLYALFHMPIGNISAIGQIVPLMTTAAAAVFLGEAVGWRRWAAISLGFLGVLIIVRPDASGFDGYALAALGAMACISLRDIVTRRFPPAVPTLLVTAVSTGGVFLLGLVMSLGEEWVTPQPTDWFALGGAALLLLAGHAAIILAMRLGAVAVVAPFRYTAILFAMAIGFAVWRDVPSAHMLVGTAIVVGTGIYAFYREQRLARLARSAGT